MTLVDFTYYLHDDHESEDRIAAISRSANVLIDDALAEKIGRPFYEVTLNCTLDTDTGDVRVTRVTL